VPELVRYLGTPTICARSTLTGQESREVKELRLRGEVAYAEYEVILADPDSRWEEIWGTCQMISEIRGDRRRFVPSLVLRLTTPDALVPGDQNLDVIREWIRGYVIRTLEDIGDERALGVLVRVMQQDELESAYLAVRTLAKFGGQNELDAMTAWLVGQKPNLSRVRKMYQYRDEMEARLQTQRPKPAGRTF
jgi:hypothetical protein